MNDNTACSARSIHAIHSEVVPGEGVIKLDKIFGLTGGILNTLHMGCDADSGWIGLKNAWPAGGKMPLPETRNNKKLDRF